MGRAEAEAGAARQPGPHLDGAPRLLDDLDGIQVGGALEAQHSVHRQLSKVVLLCSGGYEDAKRLVAARPGCGPSFA